MSSKNTSLSSRGALSATWRSHEVNGLRRLLHFVRNGTPTHHGNVLVEFVLAVPFICLCILVVVEFALSSVRQIVVAYSAMRVSRVAQVYQPNFQNVEVQKTLPPALFSDSYVGEGSLVALARPIANIRALAPLFKLSAGVLSNHALQKNLTDELLRGGDTPSPYCIAQKGYEACGYPK